MHSSFLQDLVDGCLPFLHGSMLHTKSRIQERAPAQKRAHGIQVSIAGGYPISKLRPQLLSQVVQMVLLYLDQASVLPQDIDWLPFLSDGEGI